MEYINMGTYVSIKQMEMERKNVQMLVIVNVFILIQGTVWQDDR